MCKVGDIIYIENYMSHGCNLSRHSFVVLSTEEGKIAGMDYNLVANAMSSFQDEEQKKKKLAYPGNFPITANDENVPNGHGKEGYIKADQFYYFDRDTIEYKIIGSIVPEIFQLLLDFIEKLEELELITDNLNKAES